MSIDRQRMIDTAVSFFLGGERCAVFMPVAPNRRNIAGSLTTVNAYPHHDLGAASTTNYALAVEIILKCLVLDANASANATGHDLANLFNEMDGSMQQAIWSNFCDPHQGFEWFQESLKPIYARPPEEPGKKDRPHLEIGRYPYELDFAVFDIDFLRELFIACRKTLKARNPKLQSVFEQELGVELP